MRYLLSGLSEKQVYQRSPCFTVTDVWDGVLRDKFANAQIVHDHLRENKGGVREEQSGSLWNSETSLATSKLNDNTTQMSVPIVGNKSLSSYECVAKLGPSDS